MRITIVIFLILCALSCGAEVKLNTSKVDCDITLFEVDMVALQQLLLDKGDLALFVTMDDAPAQYDVAIHSGIVHADSIEGLATDIQTVLKEAANTQEGK